MEIQPSIAGMLIDSVGIVVGLFFIYLIILKGRLIGGGVKEALNFTIWGVIFNITALSLTLLTDRLKIIALPVEMVDIHHLLMTVGMIFFLVSAKRFTDLFKT